MIHLDHQPVGEKGVNRVQQQEGGTANVIVEEELMRLFVRSVRRSRQHIMGRRGGHVIGEGWIIGRGTRGGAETIH